MSKFVRAAQTSQSLTLAAMEEASRLGLRTADIDHMFLALVINEQAAGRALQEMGIDLDNSRRAVEEQHASQLASLGIEGSFPQAGRIVFHETNGYEWSQRAADLIARSGAGDKNGDAAAVLRELVDEPSGLIADILERLGTTSSAVHESLDQLDSAAESTLLPAVKVKGRVSGSTETFVPAPIAKVWEFLADPMRVPEWELSIGSLADEGQEAAPGVVWQSLSSARRPDGKPMTVKPGFHRRTVELVAANRPETIEWSLAYPDAPESGSLLAQFTLASTTGGTQVRVTRSWPRRSGWRSILGFPMRPLQRFFAWMATIQTGGAVSRAFR